MESERNYVGGQARMTQATQKSLKKFYLSFFLVAIALAGGASYYASTQPDGLEKVAEEEGFLDTAKDSAVADSPLSDYGILGLDNERLSVGLAGVIGVIATALVALALFTLLRKKR
jgi:cobalt/nickel transport protein